MRRAFPFLGGLVFGLGLLISGMTSPAKVLAFLDITGLWDPSLAFVMGGAIITALPFFSLAAKRDTPLCATEFNAPTNRAIDKRLLIGAALFGMGWGLAGICPGPALVAVMIAPVAIWPFVASMLIGLFCSARLLRK